MLHQVMAILHYGCLNLKMPGPQGVIIVAPSMADAYLYEQEGTALTVANIVTTDFARI